MTDIIKELEDRGYIEQLTHEAEIRELFKKESVSFYIGIDPTANSMHIGHFVALMVASRLQKAGHKPMLLVGGATGLVGDPRGTGEREKADAKVIENNYTKLKAQVERIFGIECVNNYDWFKNVNYIDFLRDYGDRKSTRLNSSHM